MEGMDLSERSYKKELLDDAHIAKEDLYRNLYELDVINRLLGGHAVTLKGLSSLRLDKNKTYRILDIGCGGGDTLKAIAAWGKAKGYSFQLTGVDLKPDCIAYATDFCKQYPEIGFICCDYRELPHRNETFDIIITSLFCHHLDDGELVSIFAWCKQAARLAFIMNDLHRHALAYHSIKWLTYFFSKSFLVKNDAKLSVLRGFRKNELQAMLRKSQIDSYNLRWCWAFRWLLTISASNEHGA